MFKKLLNTQTKSISWASFILAGSYLVSAGLGFLRDHLLTNKLPVGQLDLYYTAFTVPDFIALILVFGAVSAAIVPIFSSYYVKSKDEAWGYVSNLLNIFLLCLIVVCVIMIIFAPLLISIIAPGFSGARKSSAILLMRIMFLSPIILGMSNIVSGILQVFHRFLVTALAPICYNLGIIIGILFFLPAFGLPGLAFGVILGGILHLLIQLPAFFHSGFNYKKIFTFKNPGVIKTLKLMVPRSLGLGAGQFNTIVVTAIASTLAAGSIAVFTLANNLSSFLVNAVAVSISTAVFPAMSLAHSKAISADGNVQEAENGKKDFEKKFSGAFLQTLFLTIPTSVMIFILRAQIVRFIYGSGNFGWTDTRLTAACLGIFAVSLYAQGLIFILSKTFYALHNTKIPAVISFGTVVFNILISLLFVFILNHSVSVNNFVQYILKLQRLGSIAVVGLAVAFSLTALIESSLLLILLYRKYRIFEIKAISISLLKIIVASTAMALVALFVRQYLVIFSIVELQTVLGVFLQLCISSVVGVVCYIAISYLLKSKELLMIKESFFKRTCKPK